MGDDLSNNDICVTALNPLLQWKDFQKMPAYHYSVVPCAVLQVINIYRPENLVPVHLDSARRYGTKCVQGESHMSVFSMTLSDPWAVLPP